MWLNVCIHTKSDELVEGKGRMAGLWSPVYSKVGADIIQTWFDTVYVLSTWQTIWKPRFWAERLDVPSSFITKVSDCASVDFFNVFFS